MHAHAASRAMWQSSHAMRTCLLLTRCTLPRRFYAAAAATAAATATPSSPSASSSPPRFFAPSSEAALPNASPASCTAVHPALHPPNRSIARWLYLCAGVVGGVVCFGGITRLTESGLSIVQWKPLTGVRPPMTQSEWEAEFAQYQAFPEFKQKPDMTLQEFKFIFFWEWAHRVLARSLGLVFGGPLLYHTLRGRFTGQRAFLYGLLGIMGVGGAQGFMGWYMVRSGLDPRLLEERKKATVSAYRLASHLCLAFVIYASMLRMGYALVLPRCPAFAKRALVQRWSRGCFSLMFVTAMSGAFVAGLDAGLLYTDDFPFMAGGIFPPRDHLLALTPAWRNMFENHSMVQTCHRMLAGATTLAIAGLNVACAARRGGAVPRPIYRTLRVVNALLVMQCALGMWTIMSSVDVPVAAAHQVVALLLLASLTRMCAVVGSRGVMLT